MTDSKAGEGTGGAGGCVTEQCAEGCNGDLTNSADLHYRQNLRRKDGPRMPSPRWCRRVRKGVDGDCPNQERSLEPPNHVTIAKVSTD